MPKGLISLLETKTHSIQWAGFSFLLCLTSKLNDAPTSQLLLRVSGQNDMLHILLQHLSSHRKATYVNFTSVSLARTRCQSGHFCLFPKDLSTVLCPRLLSPVNCCMKAALPYAGTNKIPQQDQMQDFHECHLSSLHNVRYHLYALELNQGKGSVVTSALHYPSRVDEKHDQLIWSCYHVLPRNLCVSAFYIQYGEHQLRMVTVSPKSKRLAALPEKNSVRDHYRLNRQCSDCLRTLAYLLNRRECKPSALADYMGQHHFHQSMEQMLLMWFWGSKWVKETTSR